VLRGVLTRTDVWAYRLPFAIQWIWPVPLVIGVFLAPESPWWLIRQGRPEDAKKALLRLTSKGDPTFNADETIAMMSYTNQIEKQMSEGSTYRDCFRGVDFRRTEVACLTWLCQAMCGSSLQGFSTYFYKQAGLTDTGAFDLSLGQYGIGIFGTLASWFLMNYFGRRTLYVGGLCVQFVLLMVVGFVSLAPATISRGWGIGSLLIISTFVYDGTIGPVCYAIVAEISSTRLKGKTIVLARNLYNVGGIINNILTNYMLTPKPSGWAWDAKSGFFYGGLCFLCIVWTYFRLPEANGRSYAELDILFERKIPARQFSQTSVDLFNPSDLEVEKEKAPQVIQREELSGEK
jgi:SP family general alpha glucoside:H+ symporter-like MFS transporter